MWASPALLVLAEAVRRLSRDEILRIVLYRVKSVDWYVEEFPSWRRVDEKLWLRLCHAACNMTVQPVIPTYAHVLVAGTLAYYMLRILWPLIAACTVLYVVPPVLKRMLSGRTAA